MRTRMLHFLTAALFSGTIISAPLHAQAYPQDRPIRVLTANAGGGNDLVARVVAQGLAEGLGRSVIVDNRGGMLALEPTVRANPDGHTLLSYGTAVFLAQIMQHGKLIYDPFKDLTPITLTATSPLVLVVTASVPIKSVAELIAYAKANPGKLSHSSANPGSSSHLTPELFKRVAGVNMVSIPYKSGSQELIDLIAGRVQVSFTNPGQASGAIKDGKLRPLAVTSAEPSALMPGLPTLTSQGLPGFFDMSSKYALFAPARTPAAIIRRINGEAVRYLHKPQVKELLLVQGVEAVGSTPEEMVATIKTELANRTKLVGSLGLIPEVEK